MRTMSVLTGAAILVGLFGLGVARFATLAFAQPPARVGAKTPDKSNPQPAEKEQPGSKVNRKPAAKTPDQPPVAEKRSADEVAIRKTDDSFVKAFEQGNAKGVVAHFTPEAEYVDESGEVFQGRQAIEESLTEFFTAHPGCKLEMTIDSIRFISLGVAIEDGHTTLTHAENGEVVNSRYTTTHVKLDGKWLAASIRDHAPKDRRQHRAQLRELAWLIGDWVDEGDESLATFSCQEVDGGNFLLRKFNIVVAGQEAMSGTQRIGWDPLTGKLRAWIFDSEGAYGEGHWHRDGENWVLKMTGVTPDGETASSTSIYTFVNAHTMTWQSVHHEIAGVQQPDSEVVTIVRQAPAPLQDVAEEQK